MARTQINPTRMEFCRLKKKLSTATRGHKLLKDKRDELMRQFLSMARYNRELRQKVEKAVLNANKNFLLAGASVSSQVLSASILIPKQEVYVDVNFKNIMSVEIPEYTVNTRTADENDIFCYGFVFTSSDLDDAVASLYDAFSDMLKLAQIEKSCQLMVAEIEKTRRRVNALEHVVIPETLEKMRYITMKLDENERANQTRLMKVKDMALKKTRGFN